MSPTERVPGINDEEMARLEKLRDETEDGWNSAGPSRPFGYRYLEEVAENPIPPPPLQIEGLCREGELFILTGPANRLKSTTVTELAVAVASGEPAFGHFPVSRPGKALIAQNEIHPGCFDERLLRYTRDRADWHKNLLIISRADFRIDENCMLLLDNIIRQEKLTFVGLDPLSEMYPDDHQFDENNPTHITALLNRLKTRRDRDLTIGFVHHDPKDAERRARGSGRLIDAPDLRLLLGRANKKGLEVARAKVEVRSRTLVPPDEFDIVLGNNGRLRYEDVSLTDEQEETLDAVSRMGSPTTAEVAKALGVKGEVAYGRLARLAAKGKIIRVEGGDTLRWRVK